MISRLSTCAAAFAILATAATLTYATSVQRAAAASAGEAKTVRVIQLEPVVITAHRLAPASR